MSEIHVKDGESIDSALKRVKRRKKSEAARKNKKRYY
mgnify:CR=1 FL=1